MTFTYAGTLATDLDKIRFHIGDTTSGAGPKPDGTNFTDEELGGLLTAEGSVGRAVAGVYEALAVIWAPKYDFTSEGQSFRRSTPSERFAKLAAEWREQYGSAGTAATSMSLTRVDAYSDDIASDEA